MKTNKWLKHKNVYTHLDEMGLLDKYCEKVSLSVSRLKCFVDGGENRASEAFEIILCSVPEDSVERGLDTISDYIEKRAIAAGRKHFLKDYTGHRAVRIAKKLSSALKETPEAKRPFIFDGLEMFLKMHCQGYVDFGKENENFYKVYGDGMWKDGENCIDAYVVLSELPLETIRDSMEELTKSWDPMDENINYEASALRYVANYYKNQVES